MVRMEESLTTMLTLPSPSWSLDRMVTSVAHACREAEREARIDAQLRAPQRPWWHLKRRREPDSSSQASDVQTGTPQSPVTSPRQGRTSVEDVETGLKGTPSCCHAKPEATLAEQAPCCMTCLASSVPAFAQLCGGVNTRMASEGAECRAG